ncbi:MAG: hypothetical protein ABWY12_15200 [Burkholderiales bacterium]
MIRSIRPWGILGGLAAMVLTVRQQAAAENSMDGTQEAGMSGMVHSTERVSQDELHHTMKSMSMRHIDMDPHMKMAELRPPKPGDQEFADEIVAKLRPAPNVPSPMKHFTNWKYAMKAIFTFDPTEPTSLFYEKDGSTYKLIGAIYTAPKRYSADDLDKRVPLSIAQWHEHVNFCMPPKDQRPEMLGPNPRFGLKGSITTKEECQAGGGRFYPVVFNWMVHVYPFEQTREKMWSRRACSPGMTSKAERHIDEAAKQLAFPGLAQFGGRG